MKFRKIGAKSTNMNTALVLSGGGAKGAYQVGVIKKLIENDISFDLIVGSSIGAMNGALLAEFILAGMNSKEISEELESIWLKLQYILRFNWRGLLLNLCTPSKIPSIYCNNALKDLISSYIPGNRKFSDYQKGQLSLTGTNLNKKNSEIFDFNSKTPVHKALLASMSFPLAFPAVKIEKDFYIDGGALSNAPLKEAILWGCQEVYMVSLQPLSYLRRELSDDSQETLSLFEVVAEFIELASHKLMYGDLKQVKKINQLIELLNKYRYILPKPFLQELYQLFDFRFRKSKGIINIREIAPDEFLEPPGLKGFSNLKAIKRIITKGEEDAAKFLKII